MSKKINFKSKIVIKRPFSFGGEHLQRAFESDRGRIINSASIRRLQQKTQVFSLERNSAVRSRLTHSLEVQQVGRFIVQTIFSKLTDTQLIEYGLDELEHPIESLVEMACLMHDIGNPPFGHSGEVAINRWFSTHIDDLFLQAELNKTFDDIDATAQRDLHCFINLLKQDLISFEGNAQAIRLIHTLHRFNLTYAQAASIFKYTREATQGKEKIPQDKKYLMKKVGFYYSERSYIKEMKEALSMNDQCRFPLSYIMEAADDISYCLADIEDAVEKKLMTLEHLIVLLKEKYLELEPQNRKIKNNETFSELVDKSYEKALKNKINLENDFFMRLRVYLIHPLVDHAAEQFIINIEAIYHGEFDRALLEDESQLHFISETFKQIAFEQVFNDPEVEMLDLQGNRIIAGLLDIYKPILLLSSVDFNKAIDKENLGAFSIEARLINKLPRKYVTAYKNEIDILPKDSRYNLLEFYYRCRLLQDFISGMTDHYALDEYQKLMVIK